MYVYMMYVCIYMYILSLCVHNVLCIKVLYKDYHLRKNYFAYVGLLVEILLSWQHLHSEKPENKYETVFKLFNNQH